MVRSALSFSKAFTVRLFYVSFYKKVPKILKARISILGVLYAHTIVLIDVSLFNVFLIFDIIPF
jgi:hypothetical protein